MGIGGSTIRRSRALRSPSLTAETPSFRDLEHLLAPSFQTYKRRAVIVPHRIKGQIQQVNKALRIMH